MFIFVLLIKHQKLTTDSYFFVKIGYNIFQISLSSKDSRQWEIQSVPVMNMAPDEWEKGKEEEGARLLCHLKKLCILTDLSKGILEISSRSSNRMQLYFFPVSILPFALPYSPLSTSFAWK